MAMGIFSVVELRFRGRMARETQSGRSSFLFLICLFWSSLSIDLVQWNFKTLFLKKVKKLETTEVCSFVVFFFFSEAFDQYKSN